MSHFIISESDKLEIKQTNKTSTWSRGHTPKQLLWKNEIKMTDIGYFSLLFLIKSQIGV